MRFHTEKYRKNVRDVTVVQPPDCEIFLHELIVLFEIPPTTRLFSIESGMGKMQLTNLCRLELWNEYQTGPVGETTASHTMRKHGRPAWTKWKRVGYIVTIPTLSTSSLHHATLIVHN
jgi:hypothetical protein